MPFTEEGHRIQDSRPTEIRTWIRRANGSDARRDQEAVVSIRLPVASVRQPCQRPRTVQRRQSYAMNAADAASGGRGAAAREPVAGRSDYAINCGDRKNESRSHGGPTSLAGAATFTWPHIRSDRQKYSGVIIDTGISFIRSEVAINHVSDGTSKTYLIGEKYVGPDRNYETGTDPGDNETWCTGYNNDNFRQLTSHPLRIHAGHFREPFPRDTIRTRKHIFGSVHVAGVNMSLLRRPCRLVALRHRSLSLPQSRQPSGWLSRR